MKKLLLMIFSLLLLLSACTGSSDPKDLLKKAFEKQKELKSYTYDGQVNIATNEEGGAGFNIPVNYVLSVITNGNDDPKDDEQYMKMSMTMFGEQVNTETWSKDGYTYTDDGYTKIKQAYDIHDFPTLDIEEIVSQLIENTESIKVDSLGSDKVLTITPKDKSAAAILAMFGSLSSLDDIGDAEGLEFEDLILTIDKDNNLRSYNMKAVGEIEGVNMDMSVDMTLRDENNTVIPEFNPDEFSESDGSYAGDGTYEDIVFDDGTELMIFMEEPDKYLVFFDDDEQLITIHNGTDLLSDGMFLNGEYAANLYNSTESLGYKTRYEGNPQMFSGTAKMKVCFSETDSDIFNANTPFSVVTFEGHDLGIVFVGYGSEEEFKAIMDQVSFEIYTGQ